MHHDDVALSAGERRTLEQLAAALPAQDRWLAAGLAGPSDQSNGEGRRPRHGRPSGQPAAGKGWHPMLTPIAAVMAIGGGGLFAATTVGVVAGSGAVVWGVGTAMALWCVVAGTGTPGSP